MNVRHAQESELDALAKIWYDGWQDAHAAIVPAELKRARTLGSFRDRLADGIADVRVIGEPGTPLGFGWVKDDELYQLYVSAAARGVGVAAALIDDAEARIAAKGADTAWLACAIGNDRAARFYEKRGWHLARTMVSRLDTIHGVIDLEVWRYEKRLNPST